MKMTVTELEGMIEDEIERAGRGSPDLRLLHAQIAQVRATQLLAAVIASSGSPLSAGDG